MKNKTAQTNNLETRPYTDVEEDTMYGPKTKPTGGAFKFYDGFSEHFYLQREADVLHVNVKGKVLNSLNVGFLNEEGKVLNSLNIGFLNEERLLEAITEKEFTDAVKEFIYNIEVDKYWN